jgi:DNA gyrase/topoisomerase IV subunit B
VAEQLLQFLDEIEHIQTRPGMYVGDISNPRTLVRELIDNALDEFINGYAKKISVDYESARGVYTIRDNGRGLPLYKVEEFENQCAAKLLFLKLFSGGKFNHDNYKWSAGLHGVGLCCVSALSESVEVVVEQDDKRYELLLENGEDISENISPSRNSGWSTSITCKPSKKYFKSIRTVIDTLPLQLAKSMFPKRSIKVNGEEINPFDFLDNTDTQLLNNHYFLAKHTYGSVIFEVYFGWSATEFSYQSKGTVNLVPCNVGWHERKVRSALGKALCDLSGLINKVEEAQWGLRVFINMFTQEPIFTSQTKDRLSHIGDEPDGFEEKLVKSFSHYMKENPDQLEAIIKKIVIYKRQLEKISDHELIDSFVRTGSDKRRGKGVGVGIWECSTHDRSKAELYIVEGRSAEGHVRRTRNTRTQAVLPLKGKPLNAAVADDIKDILNNNEMLSLINCIGAGVSPRTDISALRYGKIIIAADADADGAQISNLIIGALVYLIPEVVESGHVYQVMAPLYEQDGKYFYSLDEVNTRKSFDRFKGLGSMNPEDVELTIVNPKTRRLKKVQLDSKEQILSIMQSPSEKKRIMIQNGIVVE